MTDAQKFDYLRDPAIIYRRSFEIIKAEANLERFPENLRAVICRVIHSCGMVDIVDDLVFSGDVASKARLCMESGGVLLCDVNMVRHGIMARRLPSASSTVCTIRDAPTTQRGTRSAAGVEHWRPMLANAVCVIGNAPTALFRLLELIREGADAPAAIFAFPVGFVGAQESKQALIDASLTAPYLTLRGRRGGSAMAAAAINGLFDA